LSMTPAFCIVLTKSSDWANFLALLRLSHSKRITVSFGLSALRKSRAPFDPLAFRVAA
jgi:hypothetical protein